MGQNGQQGMSPHTHLAGGSSPLLYQLAGSSAGGRMSSNNSAHGQLSSRASSDNASDSRSQSPPPQRNQRPVYTSDTKPMDLANLPVNFDESDADGEWLCGMMDELSQGQQGAFQWPSLSPKVWQGGK
eukprot:CAMPEP_0173380484 /NCGR_PEP_ID=MMETSP1356-20130122/3157_1 /TAXON_ID=77927 ORGANISM="Hemiselmis virescens, Strain PCC157" /NCGR_SAMPLE_ID=MMETSP1356 /ASSEMBLY_ACC=CAM_ASM_000847 /LENGTH=127 /DNA_ID=CAMNT_0014334085 /DNA_START=34 /DNA_END=417 /DNA_ORIENTATION=-